MPESQQLTDPARPASKVAEIQPQRFKWRESGFARWKYGVCVYAAAFELWEIHTFGMKPVSHFYNWEEPAKGLNEIVGDCAEFVWLDNDSSWGNPCALLN
jgi:hypothetical protein